MTHDVTVISLNTVEMSMSITVVMDRQTESAKTSICVMT